MYFSCGSKNGARGAVAFDHIDAAVGRGGGVHARAATRDGEDVGLVGVERRLLRLAGAQAKHAAVAARAGPQRAVRRLGQAPDLRRRGRQPVRQLRPGADDAVEADEHAVGRAPQEVGGGGDRPERRTGRERERRDAASARAARIRSSAVEPRSERVAHHEVTRGQRQDQLARAADRPSQRRSHAPTTVSRRATSRPSCRRRGSSGPTPAAPAASRRRRRCPCWR